jgi:hypothetical protein
MRMMVSFIVQAGNLFRAKVYPEHGLRASVKKEPIPLTSKKHTLETFEKLLEDTNGWVKEWIDDKKVWVYKPNAIFQIAIEDDYYDFTESWTRVYPDKLGSQAKLDDGLRVYGSAEI